MDPLQSTETIQQFLKLLEENGRQGQAADLSQLMWYIDGMMRQFDAVNQELQEVKAQLAHEKQPAVQKIMQGVIANLENKVEWARNLLGGLWERIAENAAAAVGNFKEIGVAALDRAVSGLHIRNAMEALQESVSGLVADTRQNIEKVEKIGQELRSVGGHLKNAGRAMTGKETQVVTGGQEGLFQSAVLAPMRTTQRLFSSMNNATLAAIGNLEHLEQTAEAARETRAERTSQRPGKHVAKKPSIRQELAEKKAAVASQPVPAPDKERQAAEAAL